MSAPAQPLPASADIRRLALPVFPLILLTLWDYYLSGIRPLDFLAFFFCAVALILRRDRVISIAGLKIVSVTLLLSSLMLGWLVLQDDTAVKTSLGLAFCFLFGCLLMCGNWSPRDICRLLDALIVAHVAIQLFQLSVYLTTGTALNFHAFLGGEYRLQWVVFRASGLFQEPAHYCLMIFSLLSLRTLIAAPLRWILAIALISMLLSVSLWGAIAAVIYLLLFRPGTLLWITPLPIFAGVFFYQKFGEDRLSLVSVLAKRITEPDSDNSAVARYGSLWNLDADTLQDLGFWFGHGASNDYVSRYGASGMSFALYTFGAAGLLTFVIALAVALWTRGRLRGAVVVVFMLSAASQWTFSWWWAWIVLAIAVPVLRPGASSHELRESMTVRV